MVDRVVSPTTERLAAAGARVVIAEAAPGGLFRGQRPGGLARLRPHHPLAAGLDVYSEPELAWRLRRPGDPPGLEVTRANGRTTTTTVLAAILTAAGLRTAAIGNIGEPLVDLAGGHDVLAVELLSFQLHWSRRLAPAAECCSISPMTTWSGMAASPVLAWVSLSSGFRIRGGPHPATAPNCSSATVTNEMMERRPSISGR